MNSFFFSLVCLAYEMVAQLLYALEWNNQLIITKKSVREAGGRKNQKFRKIQLGPEKFFTFIAINFV
jgi:hypothetical protein